MTATITANQSPAIPAPAHMEEDDTLLRDVAVYIHQLGSVEPDLIGTYAAELTLTMTHYGAPYPIWVWRVWIVDPTYTGPRRHFKVRVARTWMVPQIVCGNALKGRS